MQVAAPAGLHLLVQVVVQVFPVLVGEAVGLSLHSETVAQKQAHQSLVARLGKYIFRVVRVVRELAQEVLVAH